VFELSNALIIPACDGQAVFPYKIPQKHKIFSAFYAMLCIWVAAQTAP
jgi:hypothetical protein